MVDQRDSVRAKRFRSAISKSKPSCHICGKPIDYTLKHLDPGAFVIDHVIPLHKGGLDALSNIKAAHRRPRVQQQEASTTHRTDHQTQRVTRLTRVMYQARNCVPSLVLIHNEGGVTPRGRPKGLRG